MTQTVRRAADSGAGATQPTIVRGGWGWLCGVIAGMAGIVISDLVAHLFAPAGAPISAVGSLIIELLPAGLVNWGKETLGTADKPVLLVIIAAGVLALCGFAGYLERRRAYAGGLVFAPVAAIGLVAVLTSTQASSEAVFPTAVGLLAGYLLLRALIGRLNAWTLASESSQPIHQAGQAGQAEVIAATAPSAVSRRTFLRWTAVASAVVVLGAVAGRIITATSRAVDAARARFVPPKPVTVDPIPAGADFKIADLAPYVTPNDDFYRIDTALQVPIVAADEWSLTVTGMVDWEVTISFADLLAKPLVEHVATLTCVSNYVGGDLIGNAVWLGYPLHKLLAEAGVQAGADMVLSTSQDGWTAGTPLSALTDPGRMALLAVAMNGAALPVEHGYPVRMVVPGLYGYVSATKWVRKLRVTTFAADQGYWTPLGWSALGPIKTASRIDIPRNRSVSAGPVTVAGIAWDQHTGISKVEVGIDGSWHDAELAAVTGPDTWRQWRYSWDATPGSHEVKVRATNANGELQTDQLSPPAPDGATGWHTITVKVR